jgi:hypothetical protein
MKILPLAGLLVFALAGCKATKHYPDPLPGWHNADFSVVYGRLLRIPARSPDRPPVWIVRFGLGTERYGGELALTPPERLIGYAGGENVEIKGSVRSDLAHADYPGTWYSVQSIKLWSNYH